MRAEAVSDTLADAGFPGWKATVRNDPARRGYVAVLTSPDFDPVAKRGDIHTARGRDPADAFARVLEAARGTVQ